MKIDIRHPWPYVRPKSEPAPSSDIKHTQSVRTRIRAWLKTHSKSYYTTAYIAQEVATSPARAHENLSALQAGKYAVRVKVNASLAAWAHYLSPEFTGDYKDVQRAKTGRPAKRA